MRYTNQSTANVTVRPCFNTATTENNSVVTSGMHMACWRSSRWLSVWMWTDPVPIDGSHLPLAIFTHGRFFSSIFVYQLFFGIMCRKAPESIRISISLVVLARRIVALHVVAPMVLTLGLGSFLGALPFCWKLPWFPFGQFHWFCSFQPVFLGQRQSRAKCPFLPQL